MKASSRLRPLAGFIGMAVVAPTLAGSLLVGTALAAPSVEHPTYTVGPQPDGSILMSTNQIITPAGMLVDLGTSVRAKAIALNPNGASHIGAVLTLGAQQPVITFDLLSGEVRQRFMPGQDAQGSFTGITYSDDGKFLFFSQDSSNLGVARVSASGFLSEFQHIALPASTTIPLYTGGTAYPSGIAASADGKSAYVLLNQNNTLGVIDMTLATPTLTKQIPVGNVPHSIVLVGNKAYVSNEGGRIATAKDATQISSGTPIVTNPKTGASSTGTISVVDLKSGTLSASIEVGLHPTYMALDGTMLFVSNTYDDTVSIIDTTSNKVVRTISVAIPLAGKPFGAQPAGIALDTKNNVMYVAMYNANAIAVVDLSAKAIKQPVIGWIPTASTPASVAFDAKNRQLVVADDKGTGTQSSFESQQGLNNYGTHHDTGVVNIIPVPTLGELAKMTTRVIQNNHWDLSQNVTLGPIDPKAKPKAIPVHIGEPSLIKHVFLIIKENRTYDQIFGDVAKGNGDKSLAVFGAVTPNQHKLVERFPLLDNVYAPSRQSADGHPWIVSSIAAYADDIQSPDWVRSYPGGNSIDAMVYTSRGFIWDAALKKGLGVKMYGEWSQTQTVTGGYSWNDFYIASQIMDGTLSGSTPITAATVTESATLPSVKKILDPHFPSFNTGIPDQYRVAYWLPIFKKQDSTGTVPALTIMWLPDDHTSGFSSGFPVPKAAQADNDLALGRIVEAISESKAWPTTAIFVEEDDSQNGVDHVDGHRSPTFVISPYAVQNAKHADHTHYNEASINRTIEHILGFKPLTQFDLVASPMTTAFTDTPKLAPWKHVAPTYPLDVQPPVQHVDAAPTLDYAWNVSSDVLFRTKTNKADAVDETILNHVIWYSATNFTTPYPGESAVLWPQAFKQRVKEGHFGDGDDQ